jgi:predicted nucleotidyltransferase
MEVPSDYRDLLELFNAHSVEYLVVGAYALAFHGAPQFTRDMDLLVRPTTENAERVLTALAEFGFPDSGLTSDDFDRPGQVIQLGYEPVRIDMITSVSGVPWEEAWEGRAAGDCGGVPVHYLGRDQYIANKRASGRLKDLADVEEIEKLSKPGRQRKGPER